MKAMEAFNTSGAKQTIDWDWVARAIVASAPPRLADIVGHIKFCKIWGGGEKQRFMASTLDYINVMMPNGRIVSGTFFEKLGGLKFSPSEFMPLTIHACVMAQAVLPKERENVGITVSEAHIKSLTTTKKQMGLAANAMLQKARDLLDARAYTQPFDRRIYGNLAVALVQFIFEMESEFKSMDAISKLFVGKFLQAGSSHVVEGTEVAPETTSVPASSVPASVVGFAADGSSNDAGLITARNRGFSIGEFIESKKNEKVQEVQPDSVHYKIVYLNDDGSAGVHSVKQDGSTDITMVIAISLNDLVQNFKVSKSPITLLEGYPATAASKSKELIEQQTATI